MNQPAAPTLAEAPEQPLLDAIAHRPPREAAELAAELPAGQVAAALQEMNQAQVVELLPQLSDDAREAILAAAPAAVARQWALNRNCPEGSVGRLMEPPLAVFAPDASVGETIEALRGLVKTAFVTYCYVTDPEGRLLGVVTMRDLLFSDHAARLGQIMLGQVFWLGADTPLEEAMPEVVRRHYPVYPVCDESGRLLGLVRGHALFEERAFEISAQAGSLVGVEKEERLATGWKRSFRYRHPWLQLNLLTAFVAGAVVAAFQGTLDRLVILAMFLPVLAGQSGNTGCQALAVTLRGITLGELESGREKLLLLKEAWLGGLNGVVTGLVAGLAMYLVASAQGNGHAGTLALVVVAAMAGSCLISGVFGALVPMVLRRLGTDPANASSIFLTTVTDVASVGLLLGLAALLVP